MKKTYSPKGQDLKSRLLSAVEINDSGCWNWTKYTDRYGYLNVNGKIVKAHRESWKVFKGEIPDGMHVCHTCDNPKCINPDHLFIGSQSDNMRDAVKKGRLKIPVCPPHLKARGDANGMRKYGRLFTGSNNGNSKLTEQQRKEICDLKKQSFNAFDLSEKFHVHPSTILRVCQKMNIKQRGRRRTKR